MEPTGAPEFAGPGLLAEVTLGKPGGAEDEFACLIGTGWEGLIVRRHRAGLDEGHGKTGSGDNVEMAVRAGLGVGGLDVGYGDDGAGLRHAVAAHHAEATFDCLAGETLGERGASDDDLEE